MKYSMVTVMRPSLYLKAVLALIVVKSEAFVLNGNNHIQRASINAALSRGRLQPFAAQRNPLIERKIGVVPINFSPRQFSLKFISGLLKIFTVSAIFGLANQAEATPIAESDTTEAVAAPSELFVETESGLRYKDTVIGTGPSPVAGDTVRVHYTGWLEGFGSEKKFDSSYDRRSPLVFKVGVRQVIAGMEFWKVLWYPL